MPRPASSGGRLRGGVVALASGPASYLSLGTGGVPVVLLHGFAGDRLSWQFNLSALAADRRALAIDFPGHGASHLEVGSGQVRDFAPWLLALFDALEIPTAHVVGHSMGGYVGLELARLAPDRVASLSLIASAGLGTPFDLDLLRRVTSLRDADEGLECAQRLFGAPSPLTPRIAEVLHAQCADPLRRRALQTILETSFAPHADGGPAVEWADIRAPVQALWGDADRVIPMPGPHHLPPDCPLHVFPGVGHMPHAEAAGPLTLTIRRFLSACDAARATDAPPCSTPPLTEPV